MATTIKGIAAEFGCDYRTLKKLIQPIMPEIRYSQEGRYILTGWEERRIKQYLGMDLKMEIPFSFQ